MQILTVHIKGFGKLKDKDIDFGKHVNVIYGENEAGKSTLFAFIKAMFYGLERGRGRASKNDAWSRYLPWDSSFYGGHIRLHFQEHIYRIERDFLKQALTPLQVIDETKGVEVTDTKTFFDTLLSSLSEMAFLNTVSITQLKSATDDKMVGELRNYIANMHTSGHISLNITKASTYLKEQKKKLASILVPDANKELLQTKQEILALEQTIASPTYANHTKTLKDAHAIVEKHIIETHAHSKTLGIDIETEQQKLSDAGFLSLENLLAYRSQLEGYENDFHYIHKIQKSAKIKPSIHAILAFICACVSLYIYFYAIMPNVTLFLGIGSQMVFYIALSLTLVFLVLSIAYFLSYRKVKKQLGIYDDRLFTIASTIDPENPNLENTYAKLAIYEQCFHDLTKKQEQFEKLKQDITTLQEQKDTYQKELDINTRHQWELEKHLEHLEDLKDNQINLEKVLKHNEHLQIEIDAIDLSLRTLEDLSASIKDSFGLYLNKETSKLIFEITGGVYDSLSIDENLHISMNTRHKLVPLETLSMGTMDQVYLALRIASARFIQGGVNLPLIFDDSFVNYDNTRLKATISSLLSHLPEQVLILTCHEDLILPLVKREDAHIVKL